jgi:transcription elongation factor Elf1
MLSRIIISILITLAISSGLSYFLTSFSIPFFKTFIAATVIQFTFFYFYNNYNQAKLVKIAVEKLSETEMNFENSGAEVNCANCKKQVFAPIELPEPSNFTCPHCGSENSIYLNIETAVTTRPVNQV